VDNSNSYSPDPQRPRKKHLITPYVHTPDSFYTLADGTTEYRSPLSHNQVKVETKNLSFMMKSSIKKFKVMLDILSEEDYHKFGHAFMSMIRDTSATMEEAIHYIEQNIGEIQVSVIGHNQFPYKAGAAINDKLEGVNHAG
jgi:hypothetical protein